MLTILGSRALNLDFRGPGTERELQLGREKKVAAGNREKKAGIWGIRRQKEEACGSWSPGLVSSGRLEPGPLARWWKDYSVAARGSVLGCVSCQEANKQGKELVRDQHRRVWQTSDLALEELFRGPVGSHWIHSVKARINLKQGGFGVWWWDLWAGCILLLERGILLGTPSEQGRSCCLGYTVDCGYLRWRELTGRCCPSNNVESFSTGAQGCGGFRLRR